MSSPYAAPPSDPIPRTGFGDPATLALIAFPLAFLCVMGSRLLTGLTYTVAFAGNFGSGAGDVRWVVVAGEVLSAGFALLPFFVARQGLSRLVSSDAWWIVPVLRAALVLSGLAAALRLVIAVLALVGTDVGFASMVVRG